MPVPKRKRSRARRDKRFANKGLKVRSFSKCSQCSEAIIPHVACASCGYYKGKKVLATTKAERSEKRAGDRKQKAEKHEARRQALEASAEPSEKAE